MIMHNIASVLGCGESDIKGFRAIKEGLTNTSFVFEVNDKKYVYRHPGEGTEAIISRTHEKKALELAKSIGVDPTFIYMDEGSGWKLSSFVENIRIPDYGSFEDSKKVIGVLKKLHEKKLSVDWSFLPWEEAGKIEELLLKSKDGIADPEFYTLKEQVRKCFERCSGDGVEMCFCHCDTYAPNWMLTEDDTILIDWEYAGNADPGCDIGTYIMDSMWEVDEARKFIKEYCGNDSDDSLMFHYLAYTAILSYYWYVWALYRESCGAVMGESLYNWHVMAKRYSRYLVSEYSL
jgi:thiamine kinase-like enzyme